MSNQLQRLEEQNRALLAEVRRLRSILREYERAEDARKYPTGNLTDEQRAEALRIGRIQFASAGAKRERE